MDSSIFYEYRSIFFELIRVSIGTQKTFLHSLSTEEWAELYEEAKKQSLVGICFPAVHSLKQSGCAVNITEINYLRWEGMAAKIQKKNEIVTRDVARVRDHFDAEGYDMVLMKGQGNLCNYPDYLKDLRTPGDIDVWVMPKGLGKHSMKERMKNDEFFLRWLWRKDNSIKHCYIHVIYPHFVDTAVEVHYRPSYINSPLRNRRFQRWMAECAPMQFQNVVSIPGVSDVKVAVPTAEFNVVYQLSHLYRHIFDDGLGLRQILDYYFVLQALTNSQIKVEKLKSFETLNTLKYLGLFKFATALMYVLHSYFGLDEKYLLCEGDPKAGEFLLDEIMKTGNFGYYDERVAYRNKENGMQRLLRRQKRNMKFFRFYAEEVLSVPIYRVYQEWWRIKMNWKCKNNFRK